MIIKARIALIEWDVYFYRPNFYISASVHYYCTWIKSLYCNWNYFPIEIRLIKNVTADIMNTQNLAEAKNIRFLILFYLTRIIYYYSIALFSFYKFGDSICDKVYEKIIKQKYCIPK